MMEPVHDGTGSYYWLMMVYVSLTFQPEYYIQAACCSYNMLAERSTDIHTAVLQYFNYEYIQWFQAVCYWTAVT